MTSSPKARDLLDQDLTGVLASGEDLGALPAPDTDEPMISKSYRIPVTLDEEIKAAADERNMTASKLVRQILEAGIAALRADQVLVPLAEVQQLLAALAERQGIRRSPAA
jgi:hypothetical protein